MFSTLSVTGEVKVAQHRLHLTASGVGMLARFAKFCATMNLESCHPGGR